MFTLSLGAKITISLRKTTNAECLGCFRKKGTLIKYYFETLSLHLSLSPSKDGEDGPLQPHERPSSFLLLLTLGQKAGQESSCWRRRAAVKQYHHHG